MSFSNPTDIAPASDTESVSKENKESKQLYDPDTLLTDVHGQSTSHD